GASGRHGEIVTLSAELKAGRKRDQLNWRPKHRKVLGGHRERAALVDVTTIRIVEGLGERRVAKTAVLSEESIDRACHDDRVVAVLVIETSARDEGPQGCARIGARPQTPPNSIRRAAIVVVAARHR